MVTGNRVPRRAPELPQLGPQVRTKSETEAAPKPGPGTRCLRPQHGDWLRPSRGDGDWHSRQRPPIKLTRRQFIRGLSLAGAAAASGLAYGRFVEPHLLDLSITPVPLPASRLRTPLKILHLSDFHLSRYVGYPLIEKAILLGLRCKPDLVCLTGDFITHRLADPVTYTGLLRQLTDEAPVFACFGNHDGGSWSRARGGYADLSEIGGMLEKAGVQPLRNTTARLVLKRQPLEIVGLGDLWAEDTKPLEAFPLGESEGIRIVLSHNPDSKELLGSRPWDLMLCGHTHGGQLSLPLFGTPFAPVRDHRFVAGLNPWQKRLIYTTRGIGNLHGLRFNCPPEISILELTPNAA